MSLYRFKIRNDFRSITGGTIQPMYNSGTTGNQKFDSYLKVVYPMNNPFPFVERKYTNTLPFTTENFGYFQNKRKEIKDNIIPSFIAVPPPPTFTAITLDEAFISSGNTINANNNYKNITIPINTHFNVVDYSEDIDGFVDRETKKSINKIIDGEKIKYRSEIYPSITIKFRFYNKQTNTYDDTNLTEGYLNAGFEQEEINIKNNFKKSFFRLYFFDSNDSRKQNLLLTEDLDTFNSFTPLFSLGRIFWFKNDELFLETTDNRRVYMEARFFNAKTGRVNRFINPPTTITIPPKINQVDQDWRSSELLIINPKNNNGNYRFRVVDGIGANTDNTITLTEYILKS
jgi:hypothetical protein